MFAECTKSKFGSDLKTEEQHSSQLLRRRPNNGERKLYSVTSVSRTSTFTATSHLVTGRACARVSVCVCLCKGE